MDEQEKQNKIIECQSIVGDEYVIKNLIGWGRGTFVFSIAGKDGREAVLKIPANTDDIKRWKGKQLWHFDKIKEVFAGYNEEMDTPTLLKEGDNYIIEKHLGTAITNELGNYTQSERNQLGEKLGRLSAHMHRDTSGKRVEPGLNSVNFRLDDCYNYLKSVLNEKEKTSMQKKIDAYKNRDKTDEIGVHNHKDIFCGNILYNGKADKFALIDFEFLGKETNIYDEFLSFSPDMYDILWVMADEHNKKCPNKVDFEKLKLMKENEIMMLCCIQGNAGKLDKKEIKQKMSGHFETLNRTYQQYLKNKIQAKEQSKG